jgi:hypothetical protein
MNKLNKQFLIGVLVLFVVIYFLGKFTNSDKVNTLTEEETELPEALQKEIDRISKGIEEVSFENDDFVQSQLEKIAEDVNKRMPRMINSELQANNAFALNNKVFRYSHTFINSRKEEFETPEYSEYLEKYRKELLNNINTTPEMKFFRENKVTLQYTYYDMDGVLITEFKFTPDEYRE